MIKPDLVAKRGPAYIWGVYRQNSDLSEITGVVVAEALWPGCRYLSLLCAAV